MPSHVVVRPIYFYFSSLKTSVNYIIASSGDAVSSLLLLLILVAPVFAQTTVTPSTLSFGNEAVGVVTVPKKATFKNTQTVALTISSIVIAGGTAPADYAWGGNCPISPSVLGAGQSCTIPVAFTPSALGSRTASLTITDNASNSPQSIALSGNGIAPVTLSASTLAFANQAEGTTSTAKTVTLKNAQIVPLTITSIGIVGGTAPTDYAASGNCPVSPSTLGAGLSCTISVTFTPSALGSRTAPLTIVDSAANSPQSVALSGNGISPVSVSPTSIAFATRLLGTTSAATTVTVVNHLSTTLLFSSIVTSGDFAIASNTCGSSLGAGLSCTVGITFSPTAVGSRQGTLTIYDNAYGSPTQIPLSGTGNDTGLTSITVTPSSPSIISGSSQQFTATGHFKAGGTQNLTPYVSWSSSQSNVAAISVSGLATGVTAGTSVVSATLTGTTGSTTLTVTPPVLVSIIVTPVNASIAAGTMQQFSATGAYSDHSTQNLTSSATWSSSAPTIATIQGGGLATAATSGISTISATMTGIAGSTTLTVTPPVLLTIAVSPTTASIPAGNTQQFSATGTYSDGSTQNLTSSAGWISSVTSVATIQTGGLATTVAAGFSNISATLNGVSGSATLTVTAPVLVSITVTPGTASITPGHTQQFTATGSFSDGSTQSLTSSAAWSSSLPTVATIAAGGLATGVAAGVSSISSTLNGITGSATLTVTVPVLVSITVSPGNISIGAGTAQQFSATGSYDDGSTQDLTSLVTWSSSLISTAPIAIGGLVTATAPGTSNISATLNDITGSVILTVSAPTLVSIAVTPVNASIAAGSTQQFTATGSYSDGSTQDVTSSVTWISSATSVATISNAIGSSGLAAGTTVGVTTIGAVSNAISGSTSLTVTAGFTGTGSLNTARYEQTETILNTGIVLIAGGSDSSGNPLASAELYDPSFGIFAFTGSLNVARIGATATLLDNGMVLIAGGVDSTGSPLLSAELYEPVSGAFTLTGNLNTARLNPTATLLNNSGVLIAGGSDAGGNALSTAELYSFTTGSFASTGNLNTARFKHNANLLDDGTVLISGGADSGGNPLTSAEIYNPVAGAFATTGNLNVARELSTATLLNNGTVLLAGGTDSNNALASTEIYDPNTGIFTVAAGLNTARDMHTANLLNNGTVLISGGTGSTGALTSAEIYDPATGVFAITGSLTMARGQHTATVLNNGTVLVAGGANPSGAVAAGELFEPSSLTPPNLVSIALSPNGGAIPINAAQPFIAVGTFSDGSTQQLAFVTWTSSNTAVLSITDDASDLGVAYAASAGSVSVNACDGPVCGSATITAGLPVLVSLVVTPGNPTVAAGLSTQLYATGEFSDGSTQDLTSSVTWTSSVLSVATISTGGLTTGTAAGSTIMSATMNGMTGSATLTVTAPVLVSIAIAPTNTSIAAGYTQQFAALGTFSDGSTEDLTSSALWGSSASAVATIPAGGLATAVSVGTTSINASLNNISGSSILMVTPPLLLSIAVTPPNASIPAGDAQQFGVLGTFSDGSTQSMNSPTTWSSSVPSVATITSGGLATASTQGTSLITASAARFIGTTTLTVTAPALVSVAVTPASATISVGNVRQFVAAGAYSDGSTQNLTSTATWSSGQSSVATISNASGSQGLATAVSVGTSTIQASSGLFSGASTLTVTSAVAKGVLTQYLTTWAGLQRMYYIYVPKVVAPTPSMVVFLHATYTMTAIPLALLTQWEAIANQYGIIVMWPISTWDPKIMTWRWDCDGCESGFAVAPDDSGFIGSAIVTAQGLYGISPGQTFVAGMSSGGYMTQRIGMEHSDLIGAIAPVSGAQYIQPLGTTFLAPVVANPVSVYRLNGDIDPIVPYCGGTKAFWANILAYSPSMDSDVDFWADQTANSCTSTSQSQPLCTNGGPTQGVNGQDATGCKGGAEIIFERETGVGHQWIPGTELKLWNFFQTHGR